MIGAKGSVPSAEGRWSSASNGLSKTISKDLKKRGFKYVGEITIYSHLQACGIINDHDDDCFCYKYVCDNHPTVRKRRDAEVY